MIDRPPGDEPPPSEPEPPGPWRRSLPGILFVVAVGLVLPSAWILDAAFRDDPTASTNAGSDAAVFVVVVAACSAVLVLLVRAAAGARSPAGRRAWTTVVGALAVLWGLLAGFLGSAIIEISRHPTWDDA